MARLQDKASPIDSLTKRSFIYFGLGAVLSSVSEAFWINFSSYFLINELGEEGNMIFLISQLIEGIGILLSWILITKLNVLCGNHMCVYTLGTVLMMICQPIIFLPDVHSFGLCLSMAIFFKIGSSMTIYSQLTLVSMLTNSRSRRKKLVAKATQFGLAGTFIVIILMTFLTIQSSFAYKYFIATIIYCVLGGIASILFICKIKNFYLDQNSQQAIQSQRQSQQQVAVMEINWLTQPRFYAYAVVCSLNSLYINIITAAYPYFVQEFNHITQIKYLSAIFLLYFSAFMAAILARKMFMFTGIRPLMTIGLAAATISTVFYVYAFRDEQYGPLIYLGTSITGVSKIIVMNCSLNVINDMIGAKSKSRQFVFGTYLFVERIVTGLVIFFLITQSINNKVQVLNFSWIFLPFILYALAWLIIMIERTINAEKPYNLEQKKVHMKVQTMKDIIVI